MADTKLKGKTAVVTGASSGIGRATALKLAAAGATVYATGRRQEVLDELSSTVAQVDGKIVGEAFDVTDAEKFRGFIDRAAEETGTLNIMVNNAGHSFPGTIADGKLEDWRQMVEVNILALLVGSQRAIQVMRAGGHHGHIVNISSTAARSDASGVYGATKAMVSSLATTIRAELEDDHIRMVNICPGAVITNFARNYSPETVQAVIDMLGLNLKFEQGMTLPQDVQDQVNAAAPMLLLHADDIARGVLYAVTQPINVDVFEMTIRPQKNLNLN